METKKKTDILCTIIKHIEANTSQKIFIVKFEILIDARRRL